MSVIHSSLSQQNQIILQLYPLYSIDPPSNLSAPRLDNPWNRHQHPVWTVGGNLSENHKPCLLGSRGVI